MDKDQMFEILKKLNIAYGNAKFPVTTELCDVWHEMLCDYDYEIMQEAAKRFILKSEYAPTISGLVKEYDGIMDEHNATIRRINELRDFGLGIYPCSGDFPEAKQMFMDMAEGDVRKAQKLEHLLSEKTDRMDHGQDEYESVVDFMKEIEL